MSARAPGHVTRAEVAQNAQLAAVILETAWQTYQASVVDVPAEVKINVDLALSTFQKLSDGLAADKAPTTLAGTANDVLARATPSS